MKKAIAVVVLGISLGSGAQAGIIRSSARGTKVVVGATARGTAKVAHAVWKVVW